MPMATSSSLGQCYGLVVKTYRCKKGLTRANLGQRLRLSEEDVRDIEEGRKDPTHAELSLLAVTFRTQLRRLRETAEFLDNNIEFRDAVALGISVGQALKEVAERYGT